MSRATHTVDGEVTSEMPPAAGGRGDVENLGICAFVSLCSLPPRYSPEIQVVRMLACWGRPGQLGMRMRARRERGGGTEEGGRELEGGRERISQSEREREEVVDYLERGRDVRNSHNQWLVPRPPHDAHRRRVGRRAPTPTITTDRRLARPCGEQKCGSLRACRMLCDVWTLARNARKLAFHPWARGRTTQWSAASATGSDRLLDLIACAYLWGSRRIQSALNVR